MAVSESRFALKRPAVRQAPQRPPGLLVPRRENLLSEDFGIDDLYGQPNPGATEYMTVAEYALTMDGYEYAKNVWKVEPFSAAFSAKRDSFFFKETWSGTFEDLRCCLFLMQRQLRHLESAYQSDSHYDEIFPLYRAVCEAWRLRGRHRGCLLGLAIGDAVGTALEFERPGHFEPIDDMVGGGPFGLEPGQWTDDTSMALCLAESLIERHEFDAADQMKRYVDWWHNGHLSATGACFDIGNTVRSALDKFIESGEAFSGSADSMSAGNGSLMRLAPMPLRYFPDPAQAVELAGQSSKTTHGANTCVDACRYFGGLLVGALRGESKETLLSDRFSPESSDGIAGNLAEEIEDVASGSFKRRNPPEIAGTGYVVKSLEAALWAFHHSDSFREGCLLAANLGNDADSTAAIYGQIAGAYYGEQDLPEAWLERIAMRETIEKYADGLRHLALDL